VICLILWLLSSVPGLYNIPQWPFITLSLWLRSKCVSHKIAKYYGKWPKKSRWLYFFLTLASCFPVHFLLTLKMQISLERYTHMWTIARVMAFFIAHFCGPWQAELSPVSPCFDVFDGLCVVFIFITICQL